MTCHISFDVDDVIVNGAGMTQSDDPPHPARRWARPRTVNGRPRDEFVDDLLAAIEEKDWTLAQAAQEITRRLPEGQVFRPANLSHYIQGRSRPGPKFRKALTDALGL